MDKIEEVLTRGVDKIYPTKEALEKVLRSGKKLRIYQGFDPTGPDLHIGHAVALRKLRQFQELGHHVIFLIGDFTARIGDPTGKLDTRKLLTEEEVQNNAKKYKGQAAKILDFGGKNPAEIKYNSEWLGKISAIEFLQIARNLTYQQVIERDMFQNRIKSGNDVYVNELLYPVMQAYDSVAMDIDLEIGGTDQTFNMLMGRKLMRNVKKKEKFVMTVPLLTDSDGNKIGKTEGNVIGIADPANELFAKIMTLGDNSIVSCFILLTDLPIYDVDKISRELTPLELKKKLAFELVKQFNSEKIARSAQENFEKTFQERKPDYGETKIPLKGSFAETIAPFAPNKSISGAKRLIEDGAVDVNGVPATDRASNLAVGDKIKIGERVFGTVVSKK